MTDRVKMQLSMPSEDVMRKALSERDEHFDGSFVYGVVTTGVYCRPSCNSRPPKAKNIRFFAGPEPAVAAGFRACQRCKSRAGATSTAKLTHSLAKYIDKNADRPLSLDLLSAQAHLSPTHLQRAFKAVLGVSPKAYHGAAQLRLLKNSLKTGKSVLDAIGDAGFQSTSRIYGHAFPKLGYGTIRLSSRWTWRNDCLCVSRYGTGPAAHGGDGSWRVFRAIRTERVCAHRSAQRRIPAPELAVVDVFDDAHVCAQCARSHPRKHCVSDTYHARPRALDL